MIPKIIHYTWFSNDPFPEMVQQCIQSWHHFMPDYEFVLWDAKRIEQINSKWLKQSTEKKKWAFAADFVRLYAVYTEGGIYLDTDCMVYKSFDPLLANTSFIGKENSIHVEGRRTEMYLTSHCFGAVPMDTSKMRGRPRIDRDIPCPPVPALQKGAVTRWHVLRRTMPPQPFPGFPL